MTDWEAGYHTDVAEETERQQSGAWVRTMVLLAFSAAVFVGSASALVRDQGNPRLLTMLIVAGLGGMWWAVYRVLRAIVRDGWDA